MPITAINTLSTAMYLTIWIPDWNSLDSVRVAHSRLELLSIAFFAFLAVAEAIAHKCKDETRKNTIDTIGIICFVIAVLCEGAAYPYGQRNDKLSEQIIGSLDKKANDAAAAAHDAVIAAGLAITQAGLANTASGKAALKSEQAIKNATRANRTSKRSLAAANTALAESSDTLKQLAEVKSGIAAVDTKYASRHLSPLDRANLVIRLKVKGKPPTKPISVEASLSVPDALAYATEIADAIGDKETGWKVDNQGSTAGLGDSIGVTVFVNNPQNPPPWAETLVEALRAARIDVKGGFTDSVKSGEAMIFVGRKN